MTIKWRNDGSGRGDGVNGLVVHDCVYREPVKGAKAGSGESRKPSIAKDSVASTSTAKILYILGEGEIAGLVNGGKSIYLDGTPLLDDAGNSNFDGVTWDFRAGTNEQEYIKGFPDVSNETPVNIELRSDNPWIKAFTDTQLSAVRIRFKWNRLSKTDPETGDVKGYKIQYAIDLQTNGGAYVEVLNTKIEDKTSAGYERTHRIDLPKSTSGWQIRVRRITPNDSSEYVQDDMFIDAVAEVIDVKLRYPNTALLGLQYNAETFSGIAKMAARIRGMIIRVPSNYDAVARTYTGIWDGTFKDAYSNNPAWVYFDLCTQWRYGLGERLDLTMIDKWSLYALGQYCDQMVSDGQGGLEPRFTCNVYLQKQADAYQVLSNIAGIFRAMSYWNGERIVLDADVPQDPVYTFSRANVIDGNFEYTGTRARDRHTLAKVAWDNPLNGFETEYEYIRDEKAMAKFGVKVLDLAAFGCTSQAQAQRAGLWALKTEQLETRQVSFGVGLDGFIPQVGNIINVSDELFAGRANGGRVSAVSEAQYVVTVDRDVVANIGDVLIVNGGGGQSERRTIKSVAGRKITLNAAFTAAEAENVWAIETTDLKLMRFRVMTSKQNDDATFSITAIQHEPQKYDAIDYGTDVKPTNITIVNPDVVDAPSSVTIISRHRVVQGQTVTTLVIGWSQVKDAVAYDVEWRKDDGTWIKVPRTGNVSVEIEGVYSGNYIARVRSVSAFDVQSQPTTSISTAIVGKIGLPPTIVGLTATGILFGMSLKWGFGTGSGDAAYTEIETGSAPNTNVKLLGQYSYPTNTHTVTGLQGNLSQSYRARLVDKLGFKSAWSSWVTGTTDANADKVMDLIQGQINESSLNASLTSKIGKISENEDAIGQETEDRIQAIIDTKKKADDAQLAATNAAQLAGNKGEVIYQWQTPSAARQLPQNLWIDTTGGKNTPKRWDGSAWVAVTDKAALDAQQAANSAQQTANDALGKANTANNNIITILDEQVEINNELGLQYESLQGVVTDYKPQYADKTQYANASRSVQWTYWKTVARDNYAANERITNLQSEVATSNAQLVQRIETEATATSALAREVTTLEATVGDNTVSLQETKEVVTGIGGKYSLVIDSGNKVVGYGLINEQGQPAAFDIRADRFSVSAPVGKPNDVSGTSPWMVLTTPQVIDGVTVPAGAYARNFYAPRASIDTIQIKDAAIKSAQIDNLAVTSAKIGDAQVDTLKIKKDSVIVPRVQTFSGNVDLIGSDAATGYTFGSISLDPEGGNVSIQVTFARVGLIRGTGGSSINGAIVFEVLRDGSTVVGSFSRNVDTDTYFDMATIPTMVDSNISGTHTYSVRVRHNSTRGNTTLYFREDRSIHVMGAKR
jgi:predicted phage tail protein